MQTINNLVVYGQKQINNIDGSTTYIVETSNRDAAPKHTVEIDDKLLQFVFDDGTTWLCDAGTLHELYPGADAKVAKRSGGKRSAADDVFELPLAIAAPASDRGILGDIVLKVLNVFIKKAVATGIGEIAERLENKHLKNGIPDNSPVWSGGFEQKYLDAGACLFRINEKFEFSLFDGKTSNDPFFLFIHGTNSDTLGAFAELSGSAAWSTLHSKYKNNVIAFQHRTLSESPLTNAVKLAAMLPDNANLHIISHSRGGLVGDIMCMYSSKNGKAPVGFSDDNLGLLKKESRQADIENIKALNKIFRTKKISVTKFIRVACPAAGTKLASKRLDQIFNTFFNLFGGDANPYADVLKELLSATISTKDNVDVLPGIEAQNPESPFIKVLNDQSDKNAIDDTSLAVMSGNGTFSFSGKGLLVILGKLFYWQRNDLVVNTDSMYLGAKRKNDIQYFFDQGVDVNHIKYFANTKTREAINIALKTAEGVTIPGFKTVPQNEIPGSDRDDRGLDHGELFPYEKIPTGTRPIVVLLPGIMGSNLARNGSRLWLNYISSIFGGLTKLGLDNRSITARSVIKTSYNKLSTRLSNNYDVVIYPFDWRIQLNECAKDFDTMIKGLLELRQPIKIIGHSMGGLLVRDFIINHDDTWQKLNASKGFKLLFLGSPLGGSFRIPTVLFGQDSIINSLNMLDRVHTKKELLEMFSKFPGILNLLPLTEDAENDFAEMDTWNKMRDALGDAEWPLPSKGDLQVFKDYRNNINAKKDKIDYSNMIYIAGKDKQTPCGYFNDSIPPRKELVFLYTSEGDQSVTWELGIPKQIEKANAVYYVDVTHGELANEPDMFDGIEEILVNGSTSLLKKTKIIERGEEKIFRGSPENNFDLSERGLRNSILGVKDRKKPLTSKVPITVSISAGDLFYASYPVLAGHFVNDGILYAEKIIDNSLELALSSKHQLGLYPGNIGTNELFMGCDKSFPGSIIVGLGEPGKLTSHELAKTVEQGISNYLLSIKSQPAGETKVGVSALIIGCGYGGLSIENSLKAIIEGVNNANNKAISLFKNDCKIVQHIEFIEIYMDKALSSMYALNKIESTENLSYNISLENKKIKTLLGVKKRLPLNTSEEWWNRISVRSKPAKEGSKEPSSMVFGAGTGEAREEENELYSSTSLINLFISEVSVKNNWSASSAKTIFELLVPNGLKETLKRKGNITWILDRFTAAYPWELLQDDTVNAKPLCVNAGMIRQLSVSEYRINIKRVAEEKALIIADPVLNDFISQLPGAREEGKKVEEILNSNGYVNESLINKDPASIIQKLFSEDYTLIHLAGHGVSNPDVPKKSGMVIGNDVFLTVFDIEQMTVVPELVFVNCCHLGKINSDKEIYYQERYKLAANLGTELIKIGVKAVIAAGWAVNDDAALDFAKQFYLSMFAGDCFGDAVKKARTYVYEQHPDNNTWGAYQCYGDPYYQFKKATRSKKPSAPSYIVAEEAEIDLDNLLNQLQMGKKTSIENTEALDKITAAVDKAGIRNASITEREALIYIELLLYKKAVDKFESLLKTETAGFLFSSMEKYCNVRAKFYTSRYFENADGKQRSQKPVRDALRGMKNVIRDLKMLSYAGETAERLNLLGSAYKRNAMLEPNKKTREDLFKAAAFYYTEAYNVPGDNHKIYSISNAIEIETILVLNSVISWGGQFNIFGKKYKVRKLADARKKLGELNNALMKNNGKADLNYWDFVAASNIELCQLLLEEKPNANKDGWEKLKNDFTDIWKRAGSEGKKATEFEHFQFLIYALSVGSKSTIILPKKDNDLASKIELLRTVFNNSVTKHKQGKRKQVTPGVVKKAIVKKIKKAAPKKAKK